MADAPEETITIETVEEAEEAIDRIGELSQQIAEKESEKKHEKAKLKKHFGRMVKPRKREKKRLEDAVAEFAFDNRDELLEFEDGKTSHLVTGDISFVKGRSRLVYPNGQDALIEQLKDNGFGNLVVVKEKLSKRVLTKHWDDVKDLSGVAEEGEERVKIKPHAA